MKRENIALDKQIWVNSSCYNDSHIIKLEMAHIHDFNGKFISLHNSSNWGAVPYRELNSAFDIDSIDEVINFIHSRNEKLQQLYSGYHKKIFKVIYKNFDDGSAYLYIDMYKRTNQSNSLRHGAIETYELCKAFLHTYKFTTNVNELPIGFYNTIEEAIEDFKVKYNNSFN